MNTVMELEIGPGPDPGSYVVHVLESVGGGEPTETITLDLDELVDRRPLLEATVLSSSVSSRRVMSDTEAVVQDVGRRLFDATFSGEVLSAYRTSMAVASERGSSVQIALRLTAPGLAALPWEALFDAEAGVYLCRKEPLVRHVPAPHAPPALSIEPPMRILGMISSPRGLPALDVDGEKERLEEALRPHLDSGRVELEWLDDVRWNAVHARLLEQKWHVLHFVGHGTYDVDTDEGVLVFVGRDGRADYVTASSLADLLDEAEPTPRLVVLNSCQSGAGGTTDLFSGTAAALAHSGIRAVAAMQFSISDTAAIEFARGFYTALAYGRGIDEAMRSGRIGILGLGHGTLEWVTPVLYLRGEDAQLFDVAPMPARAEAALTPSTPATAAGVATAAAGATAPGPFVMPPADAAKAGTPTPSVARTAPQPTAPAVPVRPTTVTPPTLPTPPTPPFPPTPPPPVPPVSRPSPAPRGPQPTPSWKPWLVVALISILAIAAAVTLFLLRPWDGPVGGGGTTDPSPDATVDVLGTEAQWVSTGLSCNAGDTFELAATGSILQGEDEASRVGPGGWLVEPNPGFQGQFGFPPGALIGRVDTVDPSDGFAFREDGTASYTCPAAGTLELGISDPRVDDNRDGFRVEIRRPAPEG